MRARSVTPVPTLALSVLVAVGVGCSEYGVSPEERPSEDPLTEEDPTGGVEPDPIPDDVLRGGIQGTICAEPELGLQGAAVRVEHAWGVAEVATNAEGFFILQDLPAGEHVLVVTHELYQTQLTVEVPPNEVATVLDDTCVDDCGTPVPCMGLAEAFDRDHAQVVAGPGGTVEIANVGARYDICLEPWMVVISQGSQDAIVGQDPRIVLSPGERHVFDYAVDVYGDQGDEAWWCVEERQVIDSGVYYDYNGSLAPDILFDLVQDRTDTNFNDVEDHADVNSQGRIQSQLNIWDTQVWHPIVLVGRERSLFRLETPEDTATVKVQALNLGHLPVETTVFEVVPPGFDVLGAQPAAVITSESNGSTTISWQIALEAGVPQLEDQAIYDIAELSYTVGVNADEPCQGRCEGSGVMASWVDDWRRAQQSFSEPLILEVCPEAAGVEAQGEGEGEGEQ